MSKRKRLGLLILAVLLIGCGYYAGNQIIKRKIYQDFEALHAQLPAEESVHDYEIIPIDGQCMGNEFRLERGGFSIIEYDQRPGGFTLSTYRPTKIQAVGSGCMDIADIVQVCNGTLDGLINKPMPMKYAYYGTHEEYLLHSHRAQGLLSKLDGLNSLQTDFHQVEQDDHMTGYPVSLREQAKYNGRLIQVLCEGKSKAQYRVSELYDKADNYTLAYRLFGMIAGALVSFALSQYVARK